MTRKKTVLIALLTAILLVSPTMTVLSDDEDTWIDPTYQQYCYEIGAKYNICPEILEAMIEHESWGIPTVTNNDGTCVGLCQVSTVYHAKRAAKLGVSNMFDPYGNILVAADYLRELLETDGEMDVALGHYGGYPETDALNRAGQMTEYANWVLTRSAQLERLHGK